MPSTARGLPVGQLAVTTHPGCGSMTTASAACRARADVQRTAGAEPGRVRRDIAAARVGRIGVRHGRQVGCEAPTGRPLFDLVALPAVRHAARKPPVHSTGRPGDRHSPVGKSATSTSASFARRPPVSTRPGRGNGLEDPDLAVVNGITSGQPCRPAVRARYRHLQATARLPARGWGNRTPRRRRTRKCGSRSRPRTR
jgi:hypothetical protein